MQELAGYPVFLSEHLVDTVDAVIVKRTFRPGVRKGKRAGRLTKLYMLAKAYEVPSVSYLLVDGRVIMHPAIWAQVEIELERLNNPQVSYGWLRGFFCA